MNLALDHAAVMRAGEVLDVRALETWLIGHVPGACGPLVVQQFPHGYSNLNYLLDLGGRELVLRRPAPGAARTAVEAGREYRLLASLHPAWNLAPEPVAFCADSSVIGAPFHIQTRIRGAILRRDPPAPFGETHYAALADDFIAQLVALHRIDFRLAVLGDLGRPQAYAERQIEGWIRRYQSARTPDSPDLSQIVRWLRPRLPSEGTPALIHNDFKYDNLVLDPQQPTRIKGVLDWELATLADPQLDLAVSLAYWLEPDDSPELQSFGLTHLPGNPDRESLVLAYSRQSGRRIDDPVFLLLFGLLRMISVLQQIYARYRRGETDDPRYARIIGLVHDCVQMGERAIRLDRISRLA